MSNLMIAPAELLAFNHLGELLLTPGTPVEVECLGGTGWIGGLVVDSLDADAYHLRRVGDDVLVPHVFPVERVRPAR